jgi:hypothetical protein
MSCYQVHFFTHAGTVFGTAPFEAEDDASALQHAREKLKSPWGKGHEVWQGNRLLGGETYYEPRQSSRAAAPSFAFSNDG